MIVMEIFGWIVLGVIALVIVGLIIWAVGIYNRFYSLKNSSESNARTDPCSHEKTAGHDRPAPWCSKELCEV